MLVPIESSPDQEKRMFVFNKQVANVATGIALSSVAIAWSRQPALVTAALMAGLWVFASIQTNWPLGLPSRLPTSEFPAAHLLRVSWLGPDTWACRRVFHPRSWADARVTSDELRELVKASRVQFLVPATGRAWAALVLTAHAIGGLALCWTLACAAGWVPESAGVGALWPLAPGWQSDEPRLSVVYFGGYWLGLAVVAWPSQVVLGTDGAEVAAGFWRRRIPGALPGVESSDAQCQLRWANETLTLLKPPVLPPTRWVGTWQAIASWRRHALGDDR
jgi:hypothetical protein